MLLLLHDGWLKNIFLRLFTPPCHLHLQSTIILHSCFLSFMNAFLFGEFFPLSRDFFLGETLAPGEQCRHFRQTEVQLSLIKIMNLLFFWQHFNRKYLLFFGVYCSLKCKMNVFHKPLSEGILQCFGVAWDRGRIVKSKSS